MKLVININMNFIATNFTFYVFVPCIVIQLYKILVNQQNAPFLNLK